MSACVTVFKIGTEAPVTLRLPGDARHVVGYDEDHRIRVPAYDGVDVHPPSRLAVVEKTSGGWTLTGKFRKFGSGAVTYLQVPSRGCAACLQPYFAESHDEPSVSERLRDGNNVVFVVESCRRRDRWTVCFLAHMQFKLPGEGDDAVEVCPEPRRAWLARFLGLPDEMREAVVDRMPIEVRLVTLPAIGTTFHAFAAASVASKSQAELLTELSRFCTAQFLRQRLEKEWRLSIRFFDDCGRENPDEWNKIKLEVEEVFHGDLRQATIRSFRLGLYRSPAKPPYTPDLFRNLTYLSVMDVALIPLGSDLPFRYMTDLQTLEIVGGGVSCGGSDGRSKAFKKREGLQRRILRNIAALPSPNKLASLMLRGIVDVDHGDWLHFFGNVPDGLVFVRLEDCAGVTDVCVDLAGARLHSLKSFSFRGCRLSVAG